ncbi:pimeloyl-ACP methyl ester carboxylesterase [Pseudochelatococcus lubricantis]|uniref:Pimeloyl-ACP methyl ester carboxylesterase n=1 Tax=Pseudochelatococcus lubricantis TaxID=1538102 RepID=A0ABX0V4K6_9HYPH|nr:alpha/beta hydrolase [Pseudochelatococcus lubricantis]NIJ60153.1 pimeloyl-ACP methyl ester carboxylesterase [Pseudochelatococcus lubricantis]
MDQITFTAARKFADIPSGRIAYVEQGAGPAAIFIHGVIVNGWLWRKQLEELSDLRRCIAIDLMGHGWTEIASGQDVTFDGQAQMLVEFLDALGIDKADFVANDSGTGVAQVFAAKHPDRVRTLVLTNGDVHDNWPPKDFSGFLDMVAAGGLPETLQRMLDDKDFYRGPDAMAGAYEHPEHVSDETIETYIRPHVASPERTDKLARFILGFDNAQTVRVEDLLKQVKAPTLAAWGTDDIFFPVDAAHWLQKTLSGPVTIEEFPDGRMFFPEERAEALNAKIRTHWITYSQ